jgi:hypothetical protein
MVESGGSIEALTGGFAGTLAELVAGVCGE